MSSMTIDADELIGKRKKHQRYKQILDAQIRQKNGDNSFRRRNHTTIDRSSPSFSFKNNEPIPVERRLIQQSTFLPSIADKVLRTRRGHQRSFTQGYDDESDNNNFQNDAIDYLRDCETILQNLKRLTKNSSKKASNTKILDKIQNGQSIRNSLRIQKQPSFFRSPEIDSSLVLKPNRSLKKRNENSYHDQNHRLEDSQMKTISRKSSEELKQDLGLKGKTDLNQFLHDHCSNEEQTKPTQEQKSIQTKITLKDHQGQTPQTSAKDLQKAKLKEQEKAQQVDKKKHQDSKSQQNTNNDCSNDEKVVPQNSNKLINQNIKGNDSEQPEVPKGNKTAQRNGSSPQQRKQKFLLKFLNNANTRGIELHKRIMEHKLKNRSSIVSISNLSGKKKQSKDNIGKEESLGNEQANQKVEEKGKVENLDATKSTDREGGKISNAKAENFQQEAFEDKTRKKDAIQSSKISANEQSEKGERNEANVTVAVDKGQGDRVGESKTHSESNLQNKVSILQKPSQDEQQDSKEEESNEDEQQESQLQNELLKGQDNNDKALNRQNETRQSAN